jgi:hypothetical protein
MLIGMDVTTYADDRMDRCFWGFELHAFSQWGCNMLINAAQFSYGFRSDFFSRKAHLLSSISRSLGCGVPAYKIIWPYCFPDERRGHPKYYISLQQGTIAPRIGTIQSPRHAQLV